MSLGYCQARIADSPWSSHRCPRLAVRSTRDKDGWKVLCEQHAKIEERHGNVRVSA